VHQLALLDGSEELAKGRDRFMASPKSHNGKDFEREIKHVVLRAFEQRGKGFGAGSSNCFFGGRCLRLGQALQHLDARYGIHCVSLPTR
jgi:hypothetical protein